MSPRSYRLDDTADMSEMARALSVTPSFSGPHPMVEELFRRERKTGESRRIKEFLRIDRGREV